VAFAAADVRLGDGAFVFLAPGRYLDAALKNGAERAANAGMQRQIWAGVGAGDAGNRAGFAQIRRPGLSGGLEQAAFFERTSAKVVAIKILAVNSGGSFHGLNYTQAFNKETGRQ